MQQPAARGIVVVLSDHEQEQENKDSFTAEKLPYRRVRLAHLHLLLIRPQTVNFR